MPNRRPERGRGEPGVGPERTDGSGTSVPRDPEAARTARARAYEMTHHTHLSDDRLIQVSLDRSPSSAEREHLGACSACDARREDLSRLLAASVSAATAE